MPSPSTPTAARKKVRCPKCTARFPEPAKPFFECPICSACLSGKDVIHESANGLVRSPEGLASAYPNNSVSDHETKVGQFGQGKALHEDREHSITKGDERAQDDSTFSERWEEALPSPSHKEMERLPMAAIGKLSSLSLESDHILEHKSVANNGNKPEDLLETEFISTSQSSSSFTKTISLDHAEKEALEGSHVAGENEGVKGEDGEERQHLVEASDWSLQSQLLRNTRYDFSFKYALENASSRESGDRPLNGKRSPRLRTPTNGSKTKENDLPSLRVRISNSHEECSEPSDLERLSLESDTASHDGSESDFDFPAPSPQGAQEIRLPASFGQCDTHRNSESPQVFSSMPHQLELVDNEESLDRGGYALPEPPKHSHGSQREPFAWGVNEVEKGSDLHQEEESSTVIVSKQDGVAKNNSLLLDEEKASTAHVLKDGTISEVSKTRPHNIHLGQASATGTEQGSPQTTDFYQRKGRKQGFPESKKLEALGMSPSDCNESLEANKREQGHAIDKKIVVDDVSPYKKRVDSSLSVVSKVEPLKRGLKTASASSVPSGHTDMECDLYGPPCVVQPYDGEHEGARPYMAASPVPRSKNGDVIKPNLVEGQKEAHHTNLDGEGSSENFTHHHPQMDMASFSIASSSHPYVGAEHSSSGPPVPNHFYAHQVPPHPLILPNVMPNRALTHPGYHHIISPICMICAHHQHSHLQPHQIPPCTLCFDQSGLMSLRSEHPLSHQGPGSAYASSSNGSHRTHSSSPRVGIRFKASSPSPRKENRYPPLPEVLRSAPYVTCRSCSRVLQVPPNLPWGDGTIQRIRCGACTKISKFSIPIYDHLRSKGFGVRVRDLKIQHNGTDGRQIPIATSYHQTLMGESPMLHREDVNNKASILSSTPYKNAFSFSNAVNQKNEDAMTFSYALSQNNGNTNSFCNTGSPKNEAFRGANGLDNPVGPFHSAMEEKEEGLDFGAPRISDGDSWDHSERSPENKQAFTHKYYEEPSQAVTPRRQGTALTGGREPEHVVEGSKSEEDDIDDQQRRPGSPLVVLLNQESKRFNLRLEGSTSSPPPPSNRKEQINSPSHGHPNEHHVSKGRKYIAGLLRRSLREFGKGGK